MLYGTISGVVIWTIPGLGLGGLEFSSLNRDVLDDILLFCWSEVLAYKDYLRISKYQIKYYKDFFFFGFFGHAQLC